MSLFGSLLKSRRAGEASLAWNLPGLAGPETLQLSSPAFADGAPIPLAHAAKRVGGRETSPPLSWSPAPEGTAELLLIMEDIDVPLRHPFVHLAATISAAATQLPGGALSRGSVPGSVRLLRSTVGSGYVGPAPIKGHGPHRYVFQLFALPAADAVAAARTAPRALLAAVRGPVLARARLTGTYQR